MKLPKATVNIVSVTWHENMYENCAIIDFVAAISLIICDAMKYSTLETRVINLMKACVKFHLGIKVFI